MPFLYDMLRLDVNGLLSLYEGRPFSFYQVIPLCVEGGLFKSLRLSFRVQPK